MNNSKYIDLDEPVERMPGQYDIVEEAIVSQVHQGDENVLVGVGIEFKVDSGKVKTFLIPSVDETAMLGLSLFLATLDALQQERAVEALREAGLVGIEEDS